MRSHAPQELSVAEERLARGDVHLALHSWTPTTPEAVVFYIHGIQSHAGWLFDTGPGLARQGVATYALDRRGSGTSGGPRGHVSSFQVWIDDYVAAIQLVRERHPGVPLTILGQSMGGSVAAGIVADGRAPYDALLFCAPALNQMHTKLSAEEQRAVLEGEATTEQPVSLRDEWYTCEPRFLAFMKSDSRMLRRVTLGLRSAVLNLEDFYMSKTRPWPRRPTALVVPRTDAIVRLPAARQAFEELVVDGGMVTEFPVDHHYLEFSSWRAPVVSFFARYVLHGGYGTAG